MNIIKRNGSEVEFSKAKIIKALHNANASVESHDKITDDQINLIADTVYNRVENLKTTVNIEVIQNYIEEELMKLGAFNLAKNYITYRYQHELDRRGNAFDSRLLSIADGTNEEVLQENSNKDPRMAAVQRDYFASEVSEDIAKRLIFSADEVEAHNQGIIHIHDLGYAASKIFNCCLVNLEDMLQNGTVITGTMIEKPKSFSVACTIATQIVGQIASAQYGGQTISLAHLSPFVDVTRQKFKKELEAEQKELGITYTKEQFDTLLEKRVRRDVEIGIQTIQYQVTTMMTSNGQAAFLSVFMCLGEKTEGKEREDLALVIEEVLKQRILGVKNVKGIYVAPAFPKLLYVLDEYNIDESSPYYYLTKLSAECTTKRMVPDYISAKRMKALKNGEVFGCMGSVAPQEVVTYKIGDKILVESIERMWNRLESINTSNLQPTTEKDRYIALKDVSIFDNKENKFVNCSCITKNWANEFIRVQLNDRVIDATLDHKFETENRGEIFGYELQKGDKILVSKTQPNTELISFDKDYAWLLGMILCDGCYVSSRLVTSIDAKTEDDIKDRYISSMKKIFNTDVIVKEQNRDKKGHYYDLNTITKENSLDNELIRIFGGLQKTKRQIPTDVFNWNREAKVNFLAGMMDADGYIHINGGQAFLGSINKELSIQQMKLIQSLGMNATVRINHFKGNKDKKIRYTVNFYPSIELIEAMSCGKKKINYKPEVKPIPNGEIQEVKTITKIDKQGWSYDVTTDSHHFEVSGIYSHNCRSFLAAEKNITNPDGSMKFYGRFNMGVCTLNLIDVALSSHKNVDDFWKILEERCELCHRVLQKRIERLKGTKAEVSPIHWQYGAIARLQPKETIDHLMVNGYATISLGYAGLYECVYYMTGKSLTDPEVLPFAQSVLQKMNDLCEKWKADEHYGYSVYGTPIETTTYKFSKCLKARFGVIKGVTDKNYITNSYHIHVTEDIDIFSKFEIESQLQKLSLGGCISYGECPNMSHNQEAVLSIIKYIYDTIMYAELNMKLDYCQECGYNGEILIKEDNNGKLYWQCPSCGNSNEKRMNIARRVCGYISSNGFNQGRTQEIKERVLHI